MFIFQIKSEKRFDYVITFLITQPLFFFKNTTENLGLSADAKWTKKGGMALCKCDCENVP